MAMGWAVWIVGFIVAGVGLLIIDILRRPRWW
jgi:hypothetical protein